MRDDSESIDIGDPGVFPAVAAVSLAISYLCLLPILTPGPFDLGVYNQPVLLLTMVAAWCFLVLLWSADDRTDDER